MKIIKPKKIVLIGAGAVGTSFLYSAMNRGLAADYEIIDVFKDFAEGNKLDFEDAVATVNNSFRVEMGAYPKCKDADLIVITAGRPQKEGETRLDLMLGNAQIIKEIALQVKKSGFKGVTIIASNPVDVMTAVYQKITNLPVNQVISSGTSLDSARLKYEIAKQIKISPQSINAYVLGEHGDSSVSAFSCASISGIPIQYFEEKNLIDKKTYSTMHENVWKKAYEIIKRKRATFYGIGSALADLADVVLNDKQEVRAAGAYLNGEYGKKGIYIGVPVVLGANGIEKILELKLSTSEKAQFTKSFDLLEKAVSEVLKKI